MMVSVLLCGYATGVFASRKLAKRLRDDVAFRVLAAGNFPTNPTLKEGLDKSIQDLPAHAESGACPDSAWTNQAITCLIRGPAIHGRRNLRINQRFLNDSRAPHLLELSALFVQVAKLARACRQVNLTTLPGVVLADAESRSEAALAALADKPCEVLGAVGREVREQARVDAEQDAHTAPMAERIKSADGRAAYRHRKEIVDSPNGWIKAVLGFRQFSLRGLKKARAEWRLVCMALNLRRLAAFA